MIQSRHCLGRDEGAAGRIPSAVAPGTTGNITSFVLDCGLGWRSPFFGPGRDLSAIPVPNRFTLVRLSAVWPCQLCRLRRTEAIEAEAVTPIGQAVDTTQHRRYRAQSSAPAIRNMTRIWYLTASAGGTPLRICPVIMPGKETTPVADIELMVGFNALRSD